MQMSLTRILSEIKLTVKKLEDAKSLLIVDVKANDQVNTVGLRLPLDEAKKKLQGNFDSFQQLSSNLNKLRSSLVAANATNKVKINTVEYTLAQAIDRRKNIDSEERLIAGQERAVSALKSQIAQRHDALMQSFNAQIMERQKSASNTKLSEADLEAIKKVFVDNQEYVLVDPIGAEAKLEALRKDLEAFKSEVDITLTEANSTIMVEVEIK